MVIGIQPAPALPATVTPDRVLSRLDDLVEEATDFARASRATSTVRAYQADWDDFALFCARHDRESLPADPATVALYLTDLARSKKPSTITRRSAAISVMHQRHGHPSPTTDVAVREIMRGIRRTLGVAVKEAAPLQVADVRRIVDRLDATLIGWRDRALLLVGFASAMRASELVAVEVADLEERAEGLVIRKRRSKTDQEGAGVRVALPFGRDASTCPVQALRSWREAGGIDEGSLFRSVSRHGVVSDGALSERAVSLVVKRAVTSIGLDPASYSAHSLRAGFATTAAANGASERAIAAQTGHRSMDVLRRYIRHGTVFTDNAATTLGL